jgi:uncharacterized surface protein with fasciclin (FAS1) repeats
MLHWVGVVIPVFALAFGNWALAQEQPKKPEAKPELTKPEAKPQEKKEEKNIVETAKDAKFKTLCDLLKDAGLVADLEGPGPFTLFAPTDEAFAKMDKATLDDLKKPENKHKLADFLKYHVVKGKMLAEDVKKAKELKTLVPMKEIAVAVMEGKVVLNEKVHVTKTDLLASNGVIHTIDTVLTAPKEAEKKPMVEPKPVEKKTEEKPGEKKEAEKKPHEH